MTKITVKDIRKLIENLPDNANFEIDISNGKIGKRSFSIDIRNISQIQMGSFNNKKEKLAWINIINN